MKTIRINSRTLNYKVVYPFNKDYGSGIYTKFYEGFEKVTVRCFPMFWKKKTIIRPKLLFTIYENADDPKTPKDWWQAAIMKELNLLKRKEELDRGGLV